MKWTILAALLLAGCGGGGTTPTVVAQAPISGATSAPTNAPTAAPTAAPTIAPTTAPTIAPTIAPSLKTVNGAPLTATAAQLSNARKNAQAKTTAQGVNNGVPILVESSGPQAIWAGNFVNWVTNAANGQDVPQTSGTITTTNNLLVNNPGFTKACVGSLAAACVVHPTAWEFGTDSGVTKPIGKQTLTIAFGDGTTATTFDFVYQGWNLTCNKGWVYTGGNIVGTTTAVGSDIYADCVGGNMVFPKGAVLLGGPTQDQYGRSETIMPTFTAQPLFVSAIVNVPMPSIGGGSVWAINTQDGGFAKVYLEGASTAGLNSSLGMAIHSQADGTFAY